MKRTFLVLFVSFVLPWVAASRAGELTQVLESTRPPDDSRLGKPRNLNGYFPFTPPGSLDGWKERRKELREQVLVANGLWPMPDKTVLNPVIHGKIDRDDYTIEKVFFASYPGHYVSGNLYRPKGKAGKLPGVLCPHGHWGRDMHEGGRFYDAGEAAAKKEIAQGAEKFMAGARHPLQARCVQLARMGCVVFHYDMVGYADSKPIEHRTGFLDTEAELRLQNFMGLQTYNSVRALDFLVTLPDVDPKRIGITGASGGGTQTFTLCAIDDRVTVAFPAVMVSTAMQGGCVCENCSYLRVGTGNIELAGMFAPKPLGMSGANDWTIDIETKGLPELKALYQLYGRKGLVMAKCFPQFGHNYNQVSREVMYNWFNYPLNLNLPAPIVERDFEPVPPKQLSVFDTEHPRPSDAADAGQLRKYLTESSNKQLAALRRSKPREYQHALATALRVMVNESASKPGITGLHVASLNVQTTTTTTTTSVTNSRKTSTTATTTNNTKIEKLLLSPNGDSPGERVPALLVSSVDHPETLVLWIHPEGKRSLFENDVLTPAARKILDAQAAILAPDVFMTGEFNRAAAPAVDAKFAGFTFGYNRSLLANRVHDILLAVEFARRHTHCRRLYLLGLEKAGPWVVMARALCGDVVDRTAADLNQFRFDSVKATSDEMMLPGALKYDGLPAIAALAAPGKLYLHNTRGTGVEGRVREAYRNAPEDVKLQEGKEQVGNVVNWLLD